MLKSIMCDVLAGVKLDIFFRYLNRKKLLVINYHGITKKNWPIPVWSQLPEDIFRKQIQYVKDSYKILSLSEVFSALSSGAGLVERAAMVTFDDGLENNYSVAFPILMEYSVPATIFLTMDLIGTKEILWTDELFLLLFDAMVREIPIKQHLFFVEKEISAKNLLDIYWCETQRLKDMSAVRQKKHIRKLKTSVNSNPNKFEEDFKLLTWNQVLKMKQSGLVDFGVHTANHKILSLLSREEWEEEIKKPKEKLQKILNKQVIAFCYPNGRPGKDFNEIHAKYLKECGYFCAFTTESSLFCPIKGNEFYIGRIPAGNDFQSHRSNFKLTTSGLGKYLRKPAEWSQKIFS